MEWETCVTTVTTELLLTGVTYYSEPTVRDNCYEKRARHGVDI